jgi:hypothetical protein
MAENGILPTNRYNEAQLYREKTTLNASEFSQNIISTSGAVSGVK